MADTDDLDYGIDVTDSTSAAYSQPTTTPEAQVYARRILDKQLKGENYKNEGAILDEMEANSRKAVQALREAQQSLGEMQYDPRLKSLAFARGVMSPTRSGTTAEGLGKGYGEMHDELAHEQELNLLKAQSMAQYGLAIPEEQQKLLNAKLELQKLHEQQEGPLARAALTTMGRSTIRAPGQMSPFGKIAMDEGFQPGTPEYTARVHKLVETDVAEKKARAGIDAEELSPEETAELAQHYGVPDSAPYPWLGMSTRQGTQAKQLERSKGLGELQKSDEGVLQAQSVQRDLDRFGYLNKRYGTSRLQGVPGVKFLTGFGDAASEMDKISSRLGPMMRQPGMGRMTNYDLQVFLASVPGRDKPFAVNESIRTAMGTAVKNQLDFNEYQHNYFAVHKTLEGARDAWDRYLTANPVFDPRAEAGSFKLNTGRKDYKEYFRSLHEQPSAGGQYPDVSARDRNDPIFAGMSDAEIHMAKQPAQARARGGRVKGYAGGGPVSWPDNLTLRQRLALMRSPQLTGPPPIDIPSMPVADGPGLEESSLGDLSSMLEKLGIGQPSLESRALAQKILGQQSTGRMTQDDITAMSPLAGQARGGRARYPGGGPVKKNDDYKADLEDLARSMEQGATFQWGDELNAALAPGNYSGNVVSERGQQERFATTHPWSNAGLEIAGGAGAGMGAAKLGAMALERAKGKAGRLGALAALVERAIPRGMIGKGAAVGAGAGAVSGAGSTQDMEDMPGAAAQQGLLGAILGPVAAVVAKGGTSAATALIQRLRGLGIPAGSRKFLEAVAGDKDTLDEIEARLARTQRGSFPVPSQVADVGGPRVQALAQGVATKPGERVQQFVEGLDQRQQGANTRVQELINKGLKPDDYTTKLDELMTNLYNKAKPLYDQAYARFPAVRSQTLLEILDRPSGALASKNAVKLMADHGLSPGPIGPGGMVQKPSLQYWDYVKRALDDMINTEERSGASNQGRALRDMRNKIRDEMDTLTTDASGNSLYKAARQQYGGDLEVRDALTMGRDKFGTMTARELQDAVGGMSYAERDALRTGAAENLFQKLANTSVTSNPAQRLVNVPGVAQKLQALFDSPREYQSFMGALQQEMQNFNRSRQVIATAARARTGEAAEALGRSPGVGEAAYEATLGAAGHPVWAGARAMRWMGNRLMPNDAAEGAADALAIQGGPGARVMLQRLKDQEAQLSNRLRTATGAGVGAAAATGPAMAPDPWGNLSDATVQ